MQAPIFVIGSPRSGTTLLRLMLTCHRNIVIPPECGFAVWLWPRYRHWPIEREPNLLDRFAGDVLQCRKIETWGLDRASLLNGLRADSPRTYAAAAASVYCVYGRACQRTFSRWGDKNNFYLDHIDTLHGLFPSAIFVHIVRDGRNVACSYRQLQARHLAAQYAPQLPTAAADIARQWSADIATIRASLARLPPAQAVELRFQDLTGDPERELQRLCAALGEPYDPGMCNYHVRNRDEGLEPPDFLAWKEKTLEAPQPEDPRRFRELLSEAEIRTFEAIAGEALRAYEFDLH
jgi:hypothetical protein